MGRPAKMEHARLVALFHMLALLDRNLAGAHLVHTNPNKCHEPDGRVVRLDENDGPRRQAGQVALHGRDALLDLHLLLCAVDVATLVEWFTEVGSVNEVRFFDGPRDGRMPSVVRQSAQKGLIHGTTRKLARPGVRGEHIREGVRLSFDPELVAEFHVALDRVGAGLACVGDDVVVFGGSDGAGGLVHVAREEVIPGSVAVFGLGWVADVHVLEFVRGLVGCIGDGHEVVDAGLAKPACVVATENFGGRRGLSVFSKSYFF